MYGGLNPFPRHCAAGIVLGVSTIVHVLGSSVIFCIEGNTASVCGLVHTEETAQVLMWSTSIAYNFKIMKVTKSLEKYLR